MYKYNEVGVYKEDGRVIYRKEKVEKDENSMGFFIGSGIPFQI